MNPRATPTVVFIDDHLSEYRLLIVELIEKYGAENVMTFEKVSSGLEYISSHLDRKMIVLLDIMFHDVPDGLKAFDDIVKETSLLCVILRSGQIESIDKSELIKLINNHAWRLIKTDISIEETLKIVESANQQLSMRVDGAIEEWIMRHTPDEREKPYLKTRGGQTHSLNQVLKEIRKDTNFGKEMTYSILNLVIDQLAGARKVL